MIDLGSEHEDRAWETSEIATECVDRGNEAEDLAMEFVDLGNEQEDRGLDIAVVMKSVWRTVEIFVRRLRVWDRICDR